MSMFRWSDIEIVQFLDLFEQRPCLWNPDLAEYRSPDKRSEAIQWIIGRMGVPLTEMDIRCKIKNIRSTYVRYLKRVLRARELQLPESYVPTLVWFNRADAILRTHAERTLLKKDMKRNQEAVRYSTRGASDNNVQVSYCDDSDPIPECLLQENNNATVEECSDSSWPKSDQCRDSPIQFQSDEELYDEAHSDSVARRPDKSEPTILSFCSTATEPSPRKKTKHSHADSAQAGQNNTTQPDRRRAPFPPNVHGRPTSTMDETNPGDNQRSNFQDLPHYQTNPRRNPKIYVQDHHEDEFDSFCKHLGNQLRKLPLEKALKCQEEIHSMLMRTRIEHCQEVARMEADNATQ